VGSDASEAAVQRGAQQAGTWWDKGRESRAIIIFDEDEPLMASRQESVRKTGGATSPSLRDRERELLGLLADGLTD
jgi:hypothetical protein